MFTGEPSPFELDDDWAEAGFGPVERVRAGADAQGPEKNKPRRAANSSAAAAATATAAVICRASGGAKVSRPPIGRERRVRAFFGEGQDRTGQGRAG